MMKKNTLLRLLPLLIIVIVLLLAIYFRLYQYLSFSSLKQHHAQLHAWTEQHYGWVVLLYMSAYLIVVAISLPGGAIMTIAGGYLFGIFPGLCYVVVSATLGCMIIFTAVRFALAEALARKAKGWVDKMRANFNRNAFSYLLFLRLVPIFPFWLVNIVPALLNVRLLTYISATFIGIIPGTLIYIILGNGLGELLEKNQTPNLAIIFEPQFLIPILLLAVLAITPSLLRKFKHKGQSK